MVSAGVGVGGRKEVAGAGGRGLGGRRIDAEVGENAVDDVPVFDGGQDAHLGAAVWAL